MGEDLVVRDGVDEPQAEERSGDAEGETVVNLRQLEVGLGEATVRSVGAAGDGELLVDRTVAIAVVIEKKAHLADGTVQRLEERDAVGGPFVPGNGEGRI